MAAAMPPYDEWLFKKLVSLNEDVDAEVFVTYIVGILDTDSSSDEKQESLLELLGEIVEADQQTACKEIIDEWEKTHSSGKAGDADNVKDMGDRLAEIMVAQQLPRLKGREMTAEEKARKAAILAQYAEVSEGESEDDAAEAAGAVAGGAAAAAAAAPAPVYKGTLTDADLLMFKNTNAANVSQRERDQREKNKQEAERKKEKDKADREAQRQKQQERKESEKKRTQRGERRR